MLKKKIVIIINLCKWQIKDTPTYNMKKMKKIYEHFYFSRKRVVFFLMADTEVHIWLCYIGSRCYVLSDYLLRPKKCDGDRLGTSSGSKHFYNIFVMISAIKLWYNYHLWDPKILTAIDTQLRCLEV